MTLFPYQLDGVRFLLEHPGALLADEMGLGKTVQAIGLINADPAIRTILVVCPATMKLVWKRELENWLTRSFAIRVIGAPPNVINAKQPSIDITIVNYDRLAANYWALLKTRWDLVIFDECHYLKNPEARRTKIATAIQGDRRLALSGTPLLNRPVELLPVLTWLDPVHWPRNKWHEFGLRYCGAFWNGFGWEYNGATNLEELSLALHSSLMLRRTKAEVLPSLPAKFRSVIELSVNSDLRRIVQAEWWAFERWMEVHSGAPFGPTGDGYKARVKNLRRFGGETWDNLAKARHETALLKEPLVAEYVRELFKGGSGKIVIFAYHRDVIHQLTIELLEFGPVTLTGQTPPQGRIQVVEQFQTEPHTKVFIGNIQAAGVGITLAPASSHCIFAELSWVPAEMTQAEDRLHRIGAQDNVLVQHLVLEGSVDAIMVRRLLKKQEVLDSVLIGV
jgi:SWI/SNF-related matrix-associated actin-dependent regulator of chromatin subfamily A-like protein 1